MAVAAKADFIQRNFTATEIAYASASADPSSTYAGRWAAKEAVVKVRICLLLFSFVSLCLPVAQAVRV